MSQRGASNASGRRGAASKGDDDGDSFQGQRAAEGALLWCSFSLIQLLDPIYKYIVL